jgi:hypothetical protein
LCLVFALFWSQVNHCAVRSGTRLRDFAIRISSATGYRHSMGKIARPFDAHMKDHRAAAGCAAFKPPGPVARRTAAWRLCRRFC